MPVSLPIMRSRRHAIACARVPDRWAWAMAAASASAASACVDAAGGQQALDHELHLLLAGMAGAHHAFLDVVGRIFGDLQPRLRRRQQRHGAGMAELERGGRILATKACSTAMAVGRMLGDHRGQLADAAPSAARPGPAAGLVAITPWAIWESRVPSSAITPQPIRARPGSRPRMRIAQGCVMAPLYPVLFMGFTEAEVGQHRCAQERSAL